jgi:hypothetical protein
MRYLSSGFHREVDENCALLGHYAVGCDNFLPTFLVDLSVPSLGVKNFGYWPFKMGPIRCAETSGITITRCVITQNSEVLVHSLCARRQKESFLVHNLIQYATFVRERFLWNPLRPNPLLHLSKWDL